MLLTKAEREGLVGQPWGVPGTSQTKVKCFLPALLVENFFKFLQKVPSMTLRPFRGVNFFPPDDSACKPSHTFPHRERKKKSNKQAEFYQAWGTPGLQKRRRGLFGGKKMPPGTETEGFFFTKIHSPRVETHGFEKKIKKWCTG